VGVCDGGAATGPDFGGGYRHRDAGAVARRDWYTAARANRDATTGTNGDATTGTNGHPATSTDVSGVLQNLHDRQGLRR
jgi:hypothetical protein